MTLTPSVLLLSALLALSALAALNLLITEMRAARADSSPADKDAGSHGGSWRQGGSVLDGAGAGQGRGWTSFVVRLVAAGAVAVLVGWATGWPVAAVACAALVVAWPVLTSGRRAERRDIDVLEAIVTWTQGLRDTVGGGASLEQAIGVSVEGAPPVLRPGLEQVRSRMMLRQPLDSALRPLQGVPGADFVVAALILAARRRGDRLPDVLSGIVATSAHEVAQRRQIMAARAGIHRSVQIIMAVTAGILAWMATVGAAYMAPYDSLSGQGVLAVVIAILSAGFIWLLRLDATSTGPGFLSDSELSVRQHRIIDSLARPPAATPLPSPTVGVTSSAAVAYPATSFSSGVDADEAAYPQQVRPW
ncbi:type II secretion system F family protein [Kineosporia rhizophila]|uniref:type II secretion system F family protein n=1 Tax=Kineosporia rhizophila TaxID=84633 RepID=UPI001E527B02|nr:type II secretion system F family protein [Kineosporia rhizophila]MCE0538624.1 type II secretion system F family protein [Kineosporia rhizophila]